MRKLALALLFIFAFISSDGQEVVSKITKNYFRSDPFRGEFSDFTKHLFNDPSISNKVMEKRTDSSLFYFEGTYAVSAFNPFFFKPRRMQIVLSEMVVDLDSLLKDTLFVYELLAYSDATKEGNDEIKKEFDKILKHYKNSFYHNEYTENPGKLKGSIYNFFDRLHAVSPFALSLYGPDEKKERCLILTIRMEMYNNLAMLAAPFLLPARVQEEDQ
jgi:hypothetical protein